MTKRKEEGVITKTDAEYKEELLLAMTNDCLDFADRNGKTWYWVDLVDFMIRRGWRKL